MSLSPAPPDRDAKQAAQLPGAGEGGGGGGTINYIQSSIIEHE
jgi:hypothetical protein